MIKLNELISDADYLELPADHRTNLNILLKKLNLFREAYGKPLRVTSGYRSLQHHLEIYAAKGITDQSKIPMKSTHLYGLSADIVPVEYPIKHLHDFINNNMKLIEEIGFWMEDFSVTVSWAHLQIVQYGSWVEGKSLFFKP